MNQQRCENCNTPVFRPDCTYVMNCPTCDLAKKQSEQARIDTFNHYFAGSGLSMVKHPEFTLNTTNRNDKRWNTKIKPMKS